MTRNHASLTAALAAGLLLSSAASSWANDAPAAVPQATVAASKTLPATASPPAPIRLAWDRVGIAAFGFGA